MVVPEALNPTQRATLGALGAGDVGARAQFDPQLAARLRTTLEHGLEGISDRVCKAKPLTVTKHLLNGVHGCQARYLHEADEPFEPSVPIVRGTIAHKALELAVHWPSNPLPLDLIDAAIERVRQSDHWATEFIASASPAEVAELRGSAADIVSKFLESWPPLTAAMRPATEAKMWAELCDGAIVLKGQVDLTLGQPVSSGTTARKVIVDYKTGSRQPTHRADLRFYALVETLRLGVPPRLTVTAYLNAATLDVETVTEDLLDATVARTIDGIIAAVELADDATSAQRRPSAACHWCALADACDVGAGYLLEERSN